MCLLSTTINSCPPIQIYRYIYRQTDIQRTLEKEYLLSTSINSWPRSRAPRKFPPVLPPLIGEILLMSTQASPPYTPPYIGEAISPFGVTAEGPRP